jgi:5-methylcytosine-specific restriction endonuclease McrA
MAKSFGSSDYRSDNIPKVTSDFQCFVCGSIFTTDEDRRDHLEKESRGELRDNTTEKEMEIARRQEEIQNNRRHHL